MLEKVPNGSKIFIDSNIFIYQMPSRNGRIEYKWPGDIALLSQHLYAFRRAAVIKIIINANPLK
jgi:predicted nucleic acid-binding protein